MTTKSPEEIAREITKQNLPAFLHASVRDYELQAAIAAAIQQERMALTSEYERGWKDAIAFAYEE